MVDAFEVKQLETYKHVDALHVEETALVPRLLKHLETEALARIS